jgi:hypothetical protein
MRLARVLAYADGLPISMVMPIYITVWVLNVLR